ncbi:hypothetical protein A0H81_08182 [Grifola frondosa]|uniref:Uncharacterized protein n=1 Tax=Grifola frondosa TaxID=5627 RepID=A0A1C7M5M1_GRIFR|nr:hypothetical protein A0H81_08182 [Grifola frondosa]
MSISVEDLVASFSSNHIGQEAIDLATLQAQLAQTLFCALPPPSSAQNIPRTDRTQPSNTPAARTPSSSFCWEAGDAPWTWGSAVANARSRRSMSIDEKEHDNDDMDEDERMVEDLLFSSPPPSSGTTTDYFSLSRAMPTSPSSPVFHDRKSSLSSASFDHTQYELQPPNTSLFTTTDPFYLAQLQSAQKPSAFAQAGRPAQHSPFLANHLHSAYGYVHSHHAIPPEVESHHHLFVATTAAFNR